MSQAEFSATSLDEVQENPNKFGAPTWDEFKRNYSRWQITEDEALAQVDKGSQWLHARVSKYRFEIEGYRCKTLEEVERIANSQGIPIQDLDYRPEMIPQGCGKAEILVKFVSKSEREKREFHARSLDQAI